MNLNDPDLIKAGLVLIGLVVGCLFGPKIMGALGLNKKSSKSEPAPLTVADLPVEPLKLLTPLPSSVPSVVSAEALFAFSTDPKTDDAAKEAKYKTFLAANKLVKEL